MDIAVIGAGYVGLTTAGCLGQIGHRILCVDNDVNKVRILESGRVPIFEPHLDTLISKNRQAGRIKYTSDTAEAIGQVEAIFICVGTPPLENGEADLSAIERVARIIAEHTRDYRLIVEKSTVPVSTGIQLKRHLAISRKFATFRYDVASNPEFLREGSAVEDFLHPDRIVFGVESDTAADNLKKIYQPILDQTFVCPIHARCQEGKSVPLVIADINSAEMIKHTANSFLAMKISFINLIAELCERTGADIDLVVRGIGLDARIGTSYLRPGIGFGGFCFPKDLQAFAKIAEKFGCDFNLLNEVEKINLTRIDQFMRKVKEELWVLRGKKVGVLGLAFKPNTDDVRFAPALAIIRRLLDEGAVVQAYDPHAMEKARKEIPSVAYCADPYAAVSGAEAAMLLTEWDEFLQLDLARVRTLMARPLVIDGRNMFEVKKLASMGFEYVSIGRPSASSLTHQGARLADRGPV